MYLNKSSQQVKEQAEVLSGWCKNNTLPIGGFMKVGILLEWLLQELCQMSVSLPLIL